MISPSPSQITRLSKGWFAAVDPGTRYPAAAVFFNGELVAASRVKLPGSLKDLDRGERTRQIINLVSAWIILKTGGYRPTVVVGEYPKAYKAGQSKNSADQLFPLAAISVGVAAYLQVESIAPLPSEWIGNIPKDEDNPDPWDSPRGRLIKRRLYEREFAGLIASHDAVDSAGLGLWALGRLERTFAGTV